MLTKKHFESIAKILNQHTCKIYDTETKTSSIACPKLIRAFADYLETQNPQFHREKFLVACFKEK